MSEETAAAFAVAEPDWSDRTAVIDYLVELGRATASPARAFEEAEYRDLVGRALDRTDNVAGEHEEPRLHRSRAGAGAGGWARGP